MSINIQRGAGGLADNSVTLAKMASGTDGNIISYDASGDPVAIATGDDGQVLTSAGAGQPPAFEAAAGGAWTLIATVTASNAASADFDGQLSSTYSQYVIIGTDINPATDNTFLWLRTDSNGGASYDTGGSDYQWFINGMKGNNSVIDDGNEDAAEISFNGNDAAQNRMGNGAAEGTQLTLSIFNPAGTTYNKFFGWNIVVSEGQGRAAPMTGGGRRAATAAIDSIQFLASSGNLDGVFRLYGIANS